MADCLGKDWEIIEGRITDAVAQTVNSTSPITVILNWQLPPR